MQVAQRSPWRVKMSFCSRLFYNRHHPPILSCFTNTGREPMVVIHVPYLGRYKEQFGVRAVRPPSNTYIYICIEKYRRNHINVQPAYVAIHYYVYVTFKLYITMFFFSGVSLFPQPSFNDIFISTNIESHQPY